MQVYSRVLSRMVSLLVLVSSVASTAFAQKIEEIVVTAQSRAQSSLQVPVSLEVLGGDEILKEGYRSIEQLSAFSPTLRIDGNIHGQSIRVRGVGSQGNNLALEESVPLFLDGNHIGRGEQIYSALLDVERIEVLRGPQPVYFGQNANAGAVSITSRKPTPNWEGHIISELGNNAAHMVEFGIGGPASDSIGIRVAGKYDENAGYAVDTISGRRLPAKESYSGRVILDWQLSNAFKITLLGAASKVYDGGAVFTPVGFKPGDDTGYNSLIVNYPGAIVDDRINNKVITSGPPFLPLPADLRRGFSTSGPTSRLVDLSGVSGEGKIIPPSYTDIRPWNTYLKLEYNFDNGVTMHSQTSYSDLRVDYMRQAIPEGFVTTMNGRFIDEKQKSQEFRLASPTGEAFEWMTGVYWQDNHRDQGADVYNPDFTTTRGYDNVTRTRATEDGRWLSAFATMTYNYNDYSLDIGGRYTDVSKHARDEEFEAFWIVKGGGLAINHQDVAIGLTPTRPIGKLNDADYGTTEFDPQVVIRYRPTDTINIYARFAESFKAGGFDTAVAAVTSPVDFLIDKESGQNWELGIKGRFFDGKVVAEIVGFRTIFEQLQVASFDEVLARTRTLNIGKQRVRGIEFNGQWAVTENLGLRLNGTIQDGIMQEYPGANCTAVEVEIRVCGTGGIPNRIDRSGEVAPYTPSYVINAGIDYDYPVFDQYMVSFSGLFSYSDAYNLSFDPVIIQDNTFNTNLNLGYGPLDEKWILSIWGRNLTEPVPTYQEEFNRSVRTLNLSLSPNWFKTYGIQFKYNFY